MKHRSASTRLYHVALQEIVIIVVIATKTANLARKEELLTKNILVD
jgi:hypothetical protein